MKSNLFIGFVIVVLFLPGCQTFKALTFVPHPDSANNREDQNLGLIYLVDGNSKTLLSDHKIQLPPPLAGQEDAFSDLRNALGESCKLKSEGMHHLFAPPLLAIPIIVAAGKFFFDVGVDYLAGFVEKLREKSKAEYAAKISVDNSIFSNSNEECLYFYRHKNVKNSQTHLPEMAFLLKVKKLRDIVILIPTYLWVGKSVAETAKDHPYIDMSIAITVNVIEGEEGQQAKITNLVQETFQFKKIKLGEPKINCSTSYYTYRKCEVASSIIVPPSGQLKGATISVGVVETGSHASKFDKADAQLKALKATLGPAVKEALTIELTPQ